MQERGVQQRSKVFDKTRMKRIDVNISEGGNRPIESRKKIGKYSEMGKDSSRKTTHNKRGDTKFSGL